MVVDSEEDYPVPFGVVWVIVMSLACSVVIQGFIEKLKIPLPYTTVLLGLGIFFGLTQESLPNNFGVGLNAMKNIDPHTLLLIFIPPLIFESAFATNYHIVTKQVRITLLLSGPGVVINAFLTALLCYYMLPYGWTFVQNILLGSIVSATDPVAVVSILKEVGASKKLGLLIEGESLLNDGSAFVLYMICAEFVKGYHLSGGEVVTMFIKLAVGGAAFGVLCGTVVLFFLRFIYNMPEVEITTTIMACYFAFYVGEQLGLSGVLCVVFLGILFSRNKTNITPSVLHSLDHVWEILSYIANSLIFILGGVIIATISGESAVSMSQVGYAILLYIICHFTRAITLLILWIPITYKPTEGYDITFKDVIVLWFGGLRGVIGLSLALLTRLHSNGNYGDEVMFLTSGVVLLTLVVNAPLMKPLVRTLGITKMSKDAEDILFNAMKEISDKTKRNIIALKHDFSGADWATVYKILPNYAFLLKNTSKNEEIAVNNKQNCDKRIKSCLSNCKIFNKQGSTNNSSKQYKVTIVSPNSLTNTCKSDKDNLDKTNDRASVQLKSPNLIKSTSTLGAKSEEILKSQSQQLNDSRFGIFKGIKRSLTRNRVNTSENLSDEKAEKSDNKTDKSMSFFQKQHTSQMDDDESIIASDSALLGLSSKVFNNKQNMTYLNEIEVRLLHVLKSTFKERFEEGLMSNNSIMLLEEFIDGALDHEDVDRVGKRVLKQFIINERIKGWYDSEKWYVLKLARKIIFNKLSIAFECGEEYVYAVKEGVHLLQKEMPDIANSNLFDRLQTQCNQIRSELNHLQNTFPDVYRSIETRYVLRVLINRESESVHKLKHIGLLNDNESEKMNEKLIEVFHKLHRNIEHSSDFITQNRYHKSYDYFKNVIENLSIWNEIKTNMIEKRDKTIKNCQMITIKKNEYLFKTGHIPKGIIVIVDGTAVVRNRRFSNSARDKHLSRAHTHNTHESNDITVGDDISDNDDDNDNDNSNIAELNESNTHGSHRHILKKMETFVIDTAHRSKRIDNIDVEITFISGSVLCWEYLCKKNYEHNCKALNELRCCLITDYDIRKLIRSNSRVEKSLWKIAAANIIKEKYLDQFEGLSRDKVNDMCCNSELICIKHKDGDKLAINNKTLLLKGNAKVINNYNDDLQNTNFNAPCLLPIYYTYKLEYLSMILFFEKNKRLTEINSLKVRKKRRSSLISGIPLGATLLNKNQSL